MTPKPKTPTDPFAPIKDTSCEYEGTVLETTQERHQRLATDPVPPHPEEKE